MIILNININNICDAACGCNAENNTKSYISLSYKILNQKDHTVITKNEIALDKPIFFIKKIDNLIQTSLRFPHPMDSDLRLLWNIVKTYENAFTNEVLDTTSLPILVLTVIPKEFEGSYFISAEFPLHYFLESESIGEQVNTVSFLFDAENFVFYESDDIDSEQIESEVEREIYERDRIEEVAKQKRLEREKYMEKRNERIRNRHGY